jgi:uncharacterized membrane-anchored protein
MYSFTENTPNRSCDTTSTSYEIDASKVPQVTLAFWVIKVAATTLGETGGGRLSMAMHLGYALSTAVFFTLFVVTVAAQVASKSFHPFLYWSAIVATTTAGTTMADFADRSLGIGYVGGSLVLLTILMTVLGLWRLSAGSVSVDRIASRKAEIFYWVAILFSNTLGTALGDFFADDSGLGYEGAAIVRRRVSARCGCLFSHETFSPIPAAFHIAAGSSGVFTCV